MTPLERYLMIREQTEIFTRRAMMKHEILTHINEAVAEERKRCMEIVAVLCPYNTKDVLKAMSGEK